MKGSFSQALRTLPERHAALSALALACLVAGLFARTVRFGYILLDDPDYIQRASLAAGLTADSIHWAFTSFAQANWHPLTWLSYLLDVSLFGFSPGVFHATNVALHAAATAVLFLALRSLTAAPWRSLVVALLFGIHPLHVESVTWISERKDVLSGFFFAAVLLAWSRYQQAGGPLRYVLALFLYALGLLAKPMLVTVPFVLLLLDVWPLGRTSLGPRPEEEGRSPVPLRRLLGEKGPFFALAAASSAITVVAQRAGGAFSDVAPLGDRVLNAIVAVGSYLRRAVWPSSLAVFYPYRVGGTSAEAVAASLAAILAATALAAWELRRRPWLAVGWCWYLGMLVPVLGLLQVGGQAMADRYTYLPLVGIFIAATWAAGEAISALDRWRPAAVALSGAALLALGVTAAVQVNYWRDGVSLFEHTASVTENNWVAQDLLGTIALQAGEREKAARDFLESIRSNPEYADAHFHLGLLLSEMGDPADAVAAYRRAIELSPGIPVFHNNLGNALYLMGRRDDAVAQYREALRLDPTFGLAAENLRALGAR